METALTTLGDSAAASLRPATRNLSLTTPQKLRPKTYEERRLREKATPPARSSDAAEDGDDEERRHEVLQDLLLAAERREVELGHAVDGRRAERAVEAGAREGRPVPLEDAPLHAVRRFDAPPELEADDAPDRRGRREARGPPGADVALGGRDAEDNAAPEGEGRQRRGKVLAEGEDEADLLPEVVPDHAHVELVRQQDPRRDEVLVKVVELVGVVQNEVGGDRAAAQAAQDAKARAAGLPRSVHEQLEELRAVERAEAVIQSPDAAEEVAAVLAEGAAPTKNDRIDFR